MDDLIGKYLAGEASREEVQEVERWANARAENQRYLDQTRMIFNQSPIIRDNLRFDEDRAWNNLKSKIEKQNEKRISPYATNRLLFYRIAASVIILFAVGFYFYKSSTNHAVMELVAESNGVTDTLPDGSDVFLNKKTKLIYQYDKKKKTRVVNLTGEAYFHVRHEEKKQFLIETEGIFIRDIGTSFIVKAYKGSNTVEVVVKEGEVEFFTAQNAGIHLRAPSKGVYNKETKKFTVMSPEPNALAFKTRIFTFSNQSLPGVAADINEVYDKKIIISNNLKNCYLTVTFDNENIDEIANVIAETLGLTVKRSGNEIILEGSGCEP